MRRAGEILSAEEEAQAAREQAELEGDEKTLAALRDAALDTLNGGAA
jgi:hypothetical protein